MFSDENAECVNYINAYNKNENVNSCDIHFLQCSFEEAKELAEKNEIPFIIYMHSITNKRKKNKVDIYKNNFSKRYFKNVMCNRIFQQCLISHQWFVWPVNIYNDDIKSSIMKHIEHLTNNFYDLRVKDTDNLCFMRDYGETAAKTTGGLFVLQRNILDYSLKYFLHGEQFKIFGYLPDKINYFLQLWLTFADNFDLLEIKFKQLRLKKMTEIIKKENIEKERCIKDKHIYESKEFVNNFKNYTGHNGYQIKLKYENNESELRVLSPTTTIETIFKFIEARGYYRGDYDLLYTFPARNILKEDSISTMLKDSSLKLRELINVTYKHV